MGLAVRHSQLGYQLFDKWVLYQAEFSKVKYGSVSPEV